MQLHSDSFQDKGIIPEKNSFARIDAQSRVALAENRNPHLAWSGAPAGTKSFVIICVDLDAPTKPDDVNQPDREVPADLPRADFYHWVLIDIAPEVTSIAEGDYSKGITPRGKAGPLGLDGTRQGLNDYTNWFASDRDMNGDYFGYDGPCPPWNDALIHRYVTTVYALDIAELDVSGKFTGADVVKAIHDHILDQASITANYTLNPRLHQL